MRTLRKNKQKLFYATYVSGVPIYERDENGEIVFIEVDGQQVPVESGLTEDGYSDAVKFYGNISFSGGDAHIEEFGLNLSDYSAILLVAKDSVPIDETTLIWYESTPIYKESGMIDKDSADFTVKKLSPSLNYDKYALKKLVK